VDDTMHQSPSDPVAPADALQRTGALAAALVVALVVLALAGPWWALPILTAGAAAACVLPTLPFAAPTPDRTGLTPPRIE
jgi:hypothetical protein